MSQCESFVVITMNLKDYFSKLKRNKETIPQKTKIKSSKKMTTGFTVMLIPNSAESAKTVEISYDRLMRGIASAIAVIIIMVGLLISMAVNNHTLKYGDDNTKNTILTLQQENADLKDQVSDLSVSLQSSEAVLNRIESELSKEAEAQNLRNEEELIPTEIPVKGGTAIVIQDATIDAESGEEQDGIVFSALEGSVVVATASGSVISVDSDPDYGNKIVIDHGNGYITTYRTNALLKVSFGDSVRKNDMIAIMTDEEGLVEYEITKDGMLVNPADMIRQ